MDYVIKILEEKLDNELRAKASAYQYVSGNLGVFKNETYNLTQDAFQKSYDLAQERIPQLIKSIQILRDKSKNIEG